MSIMPTDFRAIEVQHPIFPANAQGFLDWLRTQDSTTPYRFESLFDCAICRFAKAINKFEPPMAYSNFIFLAFGSCGESNKIEKVVSRHYSYRDLITELEAILTPEAPSFNGQDPRF